VARILLIDDDADFSPLLAEALEEHDHAVRWVDGALAGLDVLEADTSRFDVVLLDNCMPRMHGLELLEELRRRQVHLPVLLFTCRGTADVAIRASKLGAFRYLPKPDDLERNLGRLLALLAEAAEVARMSDQRVHLPGEATAEGEVLLGRSEPMCAVYEQVGIAARHNEPVLLTGETGTGKDLVARALFQHSDRAAGPLLKINCSAFAEDRLEDELFGYEAGAYPEAGKPLAGLFEQADSGAVLLDHFTHLGRAAQARLLRLLQEGVVQRGGRGARPVAVNVRVLACTSQPLPVALATGRLDPELYFLLAQTAIHLPPLRERGEDVPLLAEHFLRRSAATLRRPARSLARRAHERLRGHSWPGNVRELQGVIHHAVLSCRRPEIGPADVRFDFQVNPTPSAPADVVGSEEMGRRLPPSRERAYQLYRWALEQHPDLASGTDADVFEWLQSDLRVEGEGLPRCRETFERYLREARAHHDDHKHQPRLGRPAGRCVVPAGQI
jgi:two-component system nitrogen regulation response regulator GlnG